MDTQNKGIIIPQGYPIIDEVANLIDNLNSEDITVLSPSRRSILFLAKKLAEKRNSSQIAPIMFSIEDFVNFMYEKYAPSPLPLITPLDAVYFIEKANKEIGLLKNFNLDTLLPWAFKLFSDFEELYIEGISSEKLSEIDTIITEESLPEKIRDRIYNVSEIYKRFYESISQSFSTRSTRYREVSKLKDELFKGTYIIFGFYALTRAEKDIFKKIHDNANTYIVSNKDEKIVEYMKDFGIEYEERDYPVKQPEYHIYKAAGTHDEVFALKNLILEKDAKSIENVIVLPNEGNLFAVANNINVENKNISAGYPLIRTPLFSLLSFIEKLFIDRVGDKYLKTSYLNVILHPYIKNTRLGRNATITRILMHTIEEELKNTPSTYISLKDVEDIEIIKNAINKTESEGEITPEKLLEHLKNIHNTVIGSFEDIENIEDFIDKVLKLFDFVSMHTTANLHPFGGPFIEYAIRSVSDIKNSRLGKRSLKDKRSYFNLLKNYVRTQKVPFKGTPLSGLQILGTLETRGLNFRRVFYLDLNEGIVPNVKKEDTILSDTLRKYLGLSTSNDREKISRYYFFNLIKGAEEVYLFYTKRDREPSRYIEMLKWEEEKKRKELDAIREKEIIFGIIFSHEEPKEIQKTPDVIEKLKSFEFSPTSLDAYLECPLKFYYKNIIFPEKEKEEKSFKSRLDIGVLMHRVLHDYFEKWINREVIIEDIEKEKREIHDLVDKVFGEATSNELLIQKKQVEYAIELLLKRHISEYMGVKISGLEKEYSYTLKLDANKKVKIKGKIDRVHEKDRKFYIIDYKTGSTYKKPQSDDLPSSGNRDEWTNIIKSFQLPLYVILFHENTKIPYENIQAELWSLRAINRGFKETFIMDTYDKQEAYKDAVKSIISEILNPDIPFYPVMDRKAIKRTCTFCEFRSLCDRLWAVKNW